MIFSFKSPGRSPAEFLHKMDFSRLLLENMEAGVVACDENGKLVLLNRVAREWHGLAASDVSQSEWAGLYDLFEGDGVTPMTVDNIPLVRAFRGEEVQEVELVIAPKNLPRREVRCNGSRVLGEDGQVAGAVIVMNDVTERKRTENALRESEHFLREAQVVARLGTYVLDIPAAVWKCSDMLEQLFGIEEAYDHSTEGWVALIYPDDRDMMASYFKNEVLGRGVEFDKEYRIVRHSDGAVRWLHGLGKLEFDAGGHPIRMFGTIQDITDFKRSEEELQNLRTAVDQSANTIVITDASGCIEYVNPAFVKSTGYTAAEAIGQNPRVLKSGAQDAAFYQELWATISSGEIWRGQFQNRRKDGSLYWESATISPVLNARGDIIHHIAIKEDITGRKSLEANLIEALGRAESASRAKSDFLAVMSHELRTPLNGVLGFAELLAETPLSEEQIDYARTITSSGNHLLDVVNDILDFSSIEKGRLILETAPLSIKKLAETASSTALKAALDKGLDFQWDMATDIPDHVGGDERRIRQILINLLGNAVKFTMRGSVHLHIGVSSALGQPTLDFSVKDTGAGLSSGMIDLLFKPFTQADTTLHRQFEGTGLGLAISQRLAKAMGGLITVVSTPGKGSTFTFHFPIEASSPPCPTGTGSPPVSAHAGGKPIPCENGRVLVVEDDPPNSELAGKMLASLGYQAEFAFNGVEAVAAFAPGKFSAILMDMQMPVMDGLEATAKIRAIEASAGGHVPIIALTANVMPGDSGRCLAAGMDDFLSKPFKRAGLAEKLSGASKILP